MPKAIDRLAPGSRRQPGARRSRHATSGPRLESGRKGVLKRVLSEVKVAQESNQGCQNGAGLGPEDPIDSVRSLVHLHLRDVHQGPDLDRTGSSVGNLRSPGDRLVQVFDVDDINAAELLFRIREWAVTGDRFAVSLCNRRPTPSVA